MKTKNSILAKIYLPATFFILVAIFDGYYMGMKDFSAVLVWWAALLLLGFVFQPVAVILFNRFHDNGWVFSKAIGLAVSAWLLWYFSSFKLLKFSQANCYIIIFVCLLINIALFKLYEKFSGTKIKLKEAYSPNKIAEMINAEAVFFCIFGIWCYLKGFNAKAYGTEKFMDYGFLTAILKSDYMPAHDLWLSGEGINYYYVGQYISAFFIRVTGVGAGYGYNLMLMTLAAMGFSLPYSIGYNLMRLNRIEMQREEKFVLTEDKKKFVCKLAGILSGLALSIAGSMHFPIYKWIVPRINRITGKAVDGYWFADATRYIGYNPETNDKTIHEFPSYSFVLGDLHAHVINIIFVLSVVALLLAWLMNRKAKMDIAKSADGACKLNILKEVLSPQLIFCMFFIGLFHMTNYWDFPIYFVVCGAVVLFSNLITYRYKKEARILTVVQAAAFIVVWTLVALPFTLSFDSISSAIKFCTKHTPLYQLLILWGLPAALVLIFVGLKIREYVKSEHRHFLDSLSASDLFVFIIGLCGLGLVLLPEVIYVVDIYGDAYQRSNTMFKLVYQAFMLLALAMSYIVVKLRYFSNSDTVRKTALVGTVLLCSTFLYFFEACEDWFSSYYKTLDASQFLAEESPDDAKGVEWINKNVPDDAVVLEMCGTSYTFFNRISVFTGNQTVLGWRTHEWLWRSSGAKEYPQVVSDRHTDIINIYTSTNVKEVRLLLDKYNVDYIYVGEAEMLDGYSASTGSRSYNYHGESYSIIDTNHALLKSLGEVITISEASDSKLYETYIVKVDRNKEIEQEIITNDGSSQSSVSRPARIVTRLAANDTDGGIESYTEYEYNESGCLLSEKKYAADDTLISASQYSYLGTAPNFGEDRDAEGNRTGFWNYVEFDIKGNCTKRHYFADDESWVFTVDTAFNTSNKPVSDTYNYADGHVETVSYSYDGNGLLSSKREINADGTKLYEYSYDGDRIAAAVVTVNDEIMYTQSYEYDE